MGLVGAVVRRRHDGASDSEMLVLPEGAQTALSQTAGAGRAAVRSVKGSQEPPFRVRLTSQTPRGRKLMMMMMMNANIGLWQQDVRHEKKSEHKFCPVPSGCR